MFKQKFLWVYPLTSNFELLSGFSILRNAARCFKSLGALPVCSNRSLVDESDIISKMIFAKDQHNFPLLAEEYSRYVLSRDRVEQQSNINLSPCFILNEAFYSMKPTKFLKQSSLFLEILQFNLSSPELSFHFEFLRFPFYFNLVLRNETEMIKLFQPFRYDRISRVSRSMLLTLCSVTGSWAHTLKYQQVLSGSKGPNSRICSKSVLMGLVESIVRDRVHDFLLLPFLQREELSSDRIDLRACALEVIDLLIPREDVDSLDNSRDDGIVSFGIDDSEGLIFAQKRNDWNMLKRFFMKCEVEWSLLTDLAAWTRDGNERNMAERLMSPSEGKQQSILVIGDGDFSFSVALVSQLEILLAGEKGQGQGQGQDRAKVEVLATCYDSFETLSGRYPSAAAHIGALNSSDRVRVRTSVQCGVDATNLPPSVLSCAPFDTVIFNFPYADTQTAPAQISARRSQSGEHQAQSQEWDSFWVGRGRHMQLLRQVFQSSRMVLREGPRSGSGSGPGANIEGRACPALFLSLLLSQAISWDVEQIALEEGFRLRHMAPFNKADYAVLG